MTTRELKQELAGNLVSSPEKMEVGGRPRVWASMSGTKRRPGTGRAQPRALKEVRVTRAALLRERRSSVMTAGKLQ
jgi:hypothetical protein